MTARPLTGVRYALERKTAEAAQVTYEGFAHLPDADVPLVAEVTLPTGTVRVMASPAEGVSADRVSELSKTTAALVRAATKAEAASGKALPRKIVRWRG